MRILTLDNQAYEMKDIPDEVDDLRFAILDNSNPQDPDYFFIPLIFLESFNSPAVVLDIGGNKIRMPVDWKILIGDRDIGDLEMLNFSSLNDRGFDAFVFNPISDFRHNYLPVNIVDIYSDVKWFFPKLKQGQIHAINRSGDDEPRVYCAKEITKQNDIVYIDKAW